MSTAQSLTLLAHMFLSPQLDWALLGGQKGRDLKAAANAMP